MVVHNWVHIEDGESKMSQVTCWCACVCFEAEAQKMDARVLIIDGSSNEVDYIAESAGLATWQTRPSPCLGIQFGGCRWIQPWYTVTWYNHENHHDLLHKLGYTSGCGRVFCQRFRSVQPLQPNPRAPLWMPCLLANVLPFCSGKFAFWPRANMFHFLNTINRPADASPNQSIFDPSLEIRFTLKRGACS